MPFEKSVWDVMDSKFETVTPETLLKDACAILTGQNKDNSIGSGLVVMRASEEYIGLLTLKDILRFFLYLYNQSMIAGKPGEWLNKIGAQGINDVLVTVNDVLVRYDVFARPNQKLIEVIKQMEDLDIEIIPVVDVGKVIGVIRSSAIIKEVIQMVK